ncbi:MAG: hypothetical protein ACM3KR_01070 [Deltaproteobacteria bacterium]
MNATTLMTRHEGYTYIKPKMNEKERKCLDAIRIYGSGIAETIGENMARDGSLFGIKIPEKYIKVMQFRGLIQPRLNSLEEKGILKAENMAVNHKTGIKNAVYEIAEPYIHTDTSGQIKMWG